jgi:tRNA(Ile2) C34 agmatinyltransferase TiaS
MNNSDTPTCRYCRKQTTSGKTNYYGGFVCSRSCDYNAALELERSMPGHGYAQKEVGTDAYRKIKLNWDTNEKN